MITWSLESLF
jgi:hypothetical protein